MKELRDNPGIFETTRVGRVKGEPREEVGGNGGAAVKDGGVYIVVKTHR